MIKNILTTITLLAIFITPVFSQIYGINNFNTHNMFYYNPAHTGDQGGFAGFMSYRNHLSSISDAPKSLYFGIHSPISKKMSLGGLFSAQSKGLIEQASIRLDYSYRTQISKYQTLAFGINFGNYRTNINTDNVVAFDYDDPVLYSEYNMQNLFYAGAGISYKLKNLELDLIIPLLYRTNSDTVSRYMSHLAYKFKITETINVKPSISASYQTSYGTTGEANIMFDYKNQFWVQATYKKNNSKVISAGVFVGKLGIAYAYETNYGTLSYLGGPSHEVMLTYGFNKIKEIIKDTLVLDTIANPNFIRTIEDKTYEEYVLSNNYGFYNTALELTDSLRVPKTNYKPEVAVVDSIKQNPVQELTKNEYDILKKGVHFERNSAMLAEGSRIYLDSVADLMKNNTKIRLLVTGYTCDLGSEITNEKYSKMRAEVVKYYLKSQGVEDSRITTDAKSDAQPIVPNTSEQNRETNRRVDFAILRD